MRDLRQIEHDDLQATINEAFETGRLRELGRVLTDRDYELLNESAYKHARREAWLRHKAASKAEFWAKRG